MWQPWNGLEVFDPQAWSFGPDAKFFDGDGFGHTTAVDGTNANGFANGEVYAAVPPEMCKAVPAIDSGVKKALMRIHCDDNGNNNQQGSEGEVNKSSFMAAAAKKFYGTSEVNNKSDLNIPTDAEVNAAIFA